MTKLAQYKKELADLMDTYNDPDTPKDIKDVMEQAIESVKKLIKEEEEKESKEPAKKAAAPKKETPAKAPVKRIAAKKPKEAKEAPAKKAAMTALEKCKDIIAKYREKKKADAERIEKRKKAGKPAELTPAETVSKAAKKVEAKVVEMERPLKVSEEAALISGVVKTVVSALEGIEKPERQKRFVQKIIENLQRLNKGIKLRAEDGMYLEDEELEMDDMGEAGDMGELAEALMGKVNEIHHHAKEIKEALQKGAEVEDWVLMKSTRASTDLSDIAHYLDNDVAEGDKMVFGGSFFNSAAPAKKWKADEFEEMNQALVDVYKNLYVIEDREIRKDIEDKVYEIQEMLETYGTDSLPYADGGGVEDGYMAKGGMIDYSKDGYVKAIRGVDGKMVKEVMVNDVLYRYNPIYKTYNSVTDNELLHKNDYDGASGGHMAKGGTTFGKFGSGRMNKNAWVSANYIGDSKVTLGELQSYLERNTSEKFDKDKIYTITRTLFQTGDYTIDDKKEWKESIIYRKRKMASGGHMAKGGIIKTIESSHKNPYLFLEELDAAVDGDVNYTTQNGIDFYVGDIGNTAVVVAFIDNPNNYLITKEDAREMSHAAKTKGIDKVVLYTDFALELHSKHEKPSDIGFDMIYKVIGEYEKGGHMEKGGYNRSWHQDRAQYNKSERWEKPLNQRKSSYADGGTTNRVTYPDLSKVKPNVID